MQEGFIGEIRQVLQRNGTTQAVGWLATVIRPSDGSTSGGGRVEHAIVALTPEQATYPNPQRSSPVLLRLERERGKFLLQAPDSTQVCVHCRRKCQLKQQ